MYSDMKELVILIAEDDDGHAELIEEGLRDVGVCNDILRFCNGLELWSFLNKDISKTGDVYKVIDESKSYLILLDINMPVMDGVEVLAKISQNEKLKSFPIIMLTTTDDPREIHQCYELGCNIYITKPVDFGKFAETLKRLGLFIQIVKV